ncbi:MAG: DNA polymerase IV [Deltaproteobacteria bacterium]|nr:DNA polymerase IV [Deltaproteobacteria bacterium]
MHIDMDAFYASIEQLDHPEWRGKPLVVGGQSGQSDRGVVSAASYEVRKYGVRSAMPVFQARRLCPHAIFAPGRHWRYAEVSAQVMEVLRDFSPVVEQASIDEAYLDAGGLERLFGPAPELGRKIKLAVLERTGLTCSIGLAPVKFLAKIASDLDKPDGLSILRPEDLPAFLATLPLERIPGLGRQTLKKIASYGMRTAGDAQKYPEDFWVQRFGKAGKVLYERCHGIDPRELEPDTAAKSESAENTFEQDTDDHEELKTWLMIQAERVGASLRKHGYRGRTITLKIKYADFSQHTRSKSLAEYTDSTRVIYEVGLRLLEETQLEGKLRLIGLGVSNFESEEAAQRSGEAVATTTLGLPGISLVKKEDKFLTGLDRSREQALDKALDQVRQRFGASVVMRGRVFENKDKQ